MGLIGSMGNLNASLHFGVHGLCCRLPLQAGGKWCVVRVPVGRTPKAGMYAVILYRSFLLLEDPA